MRLHLTALDVFTAKKSGVQWAKLSGVSAETGETVEAMVEASKIEVEKVKEAVLSPEELKEALGGYEPTQVFFDKRGRLDSVQV